MKRLSTWVLIAVALVSLAAGTVNAQDLFTRLAFTGFVFVFDLGCYDDIYGWQNCSTHGVYSSMVLPDSEVLQGSSPSWGPDGRHFVFANGDIFVSPYPNVRYDTRITNTLNNWGPAWSPDGREIAFLSNRDGSLDLYVMNPDGSDIRRLTFNVLPNELAWSADSRRIAFTCVVESSNSDICAINEDGTGLMRLTADPAADSHPTWSPDGTSIAFTTTRFDSSNPAVALMNADGTGVSWLTMGWHPAWSLDGILAFSGYQTTQGYLGYGIYTIRPDGTDVQPLREYCGVCRPPSGAYDGNLGFFDGGASNPVWMPAPVLVARFTFACDRATCSFDGSGSTDRSGSITRYTWDFGDGATSSSLEATATHTYATGGTYSVTLTVSDGTSDSIPETRTVFIASVIPPTVTITTPSAGASFVAPASVTITATASEIDGTVVTVAFYNGSSFIGASTAAPYTMTWTAVPVGTYSLSAVATNNGGLSSTSASVPISVVPPLLVSFTYACSALVCTFDGSSSQGTVTSYAWSFGDGLTASGPTVAHTYRGAGTYMVTLVIGDAGGRTASTGQSVKVSRRLRLKE